MSQNQHGDMVLRWGSSLSISMYLSIIDFRVLKLGWVLVLAPCMLVPIFWMYNYNELLSLRLSV